MVAVHVVRGYAALVKAQKRRFGAREMSLLRPLPGSGYGFAASRMPYSEYDEHHYQQMMADLRAAKKKRSDAAEAALAALREAQTEGTGDGSAPKQPEPDPEDTSTDNREPEEELPAEVLEDALRTASEQLEVDHAGELAALRDEYEGKLDRYRTALAKVRRLAHRHPEMTGRAALDIFDTLMEDPFTLNDIEEE